MYKEYTGKTLEDAKAEAAKDLGIREDLLNIEVTEEEKGGLFGLRKSVKIRVAVPETEAAEEIFEEAVEVTVTEAVTETVTETVDKIKESFAEASSVEAAKGETPEEVAVDFVQKLLAQMDFHAEIKAIVSEEEETIYIEIEGEDMGTLIGKRGQTLDALQYLTSLVVNRACNQYYKIKLDTENYRERRKETLENLAKNIAMKVKKTHRSVALEPMNPYERRIIHAALQNDKYVETHSEGEEPYRKVIVSMKKGVTYERRGYYGNSDRFGNNNRYGRGGYNRGGNRFNKGNRYNDNRGKQYAKDENSSDYSKDYMKDYAAYKEAKAAEKAKNDGQAE